MRVAFIGIGAMGEPMAGNLVKKGFAVSALQNRRTEPASRLKSLGAKIASSVADVVAGSEVIVLCLPTSREVEQTVLGPAGVLSAAATGSVVLDCSTSNPSSTRMLATQLANRGIGMVDAGMTRGVAGAKQGTLAFFLGGADRHIDKVLPVLEAMGDTFVRFGPVSHGHTAKVISNVLSYGTVALVNEAIMLGARAGVDLKTLYEALTQGAPSKALEAFGPRLVSGDYEPVRVSVEHVCEDMVLAQELAALAQAPVFMLGAAQELYRLMALNGKGSRDMSAIAELWRGAGKE
jgi:3-hydroxyisobutyrate dehydrogenase